MFLNLTTLLLLLVAGDPSSHVPTARPLGDRVVPVTFDSAALAGARRYLVWLPPDYRADAGDYPLVVLLHGLGGEGADWFDPELGDLRPKLSSMMREGRIDRFIAVAPDGGDGYWTDHVGAPRERYGTFIDEVVADADQRFPIAVERAAIVGVSMGGHGSMSRALMDPGRYRAVVAIAGALFDTPPTHRDVYKRVWGFPADPAHWQATSPVALLRALPISGPLPAIFLVCGRADKDRFLALAEGAARLMSARGIPHELLLTDGGHTWRAWRASFDRWLGWLAPHLR